MATSVAIVTAVTMATTVSSYSSPTGMHLHFKIREKLLAQGSGFHQGTHYSELHEATFKGFSTGENS